MEDKIKNAEKREAPYKWRFGLFLRTVAWIVIITFSWQQVAPAADMDSFRWDSKEKKMASTYSVIEYLKQQKQEQENLRRKAITEYYKDRAVQGVFYDVRLNEFVNSMAGMFNAMKLQEQMWKAANLTHKANTTYLPEYNKDGSVKTTWSRAGLTIAVLNEHLDDGFGNVTVRDTYNMQYSDRALMIAYEAKEKDRFGRETYVKWHGAQYTGDSKFYAGEDTAANKNLTEFIEERVEQETKYDASGKEYIYEKHSYQHVYGGVYQGKRMTSCNTTGWEDGRGEYYYTRSSMGYDGEGNLTGYREEGWSQAEGKYWTDWSASYSHFDNMDNDIVSSYTMRGWSESRGEEYSLTWQGDYYSNGRLKGFTQTEESEANGTTVYKREDTVYEGNNITSYRDSLQDKNGDITTLDFYDAVYDSQECLLSSTKKLTDAYGNATYFDFEGAYNPLRQMASYKEVATDNKGLITTKLWQAGEYDKIGRVLSYSERTSSSDDPDVITEKNLINIIYDAVSMMADFDSIERTYGTDKDGKLVDITETISRDYVEYDEKGDLLFYVETITRQGTDSYGNSVNTKDEKVVTFKTGINDKAEMYAISSFYDELDHKTGNSQIVGLPAEWETYAVEQKIAFFESLGSLSFAVNGQKVDFGAMTDDQKEAFVAGFNASGFVLDITYDITTESNYTFIKNNSGQVIGSTQISKNSATPDVVSTILKSGICYDVDGRMTGYSEITANNISNIVEELSVSKIFYDSAERILGQTKVTHVAGQSATTGEKVDYTTTSVESGMSYDVLGNITGYAEISTNSFTTVQNTTVVSDITYNGLGQIYSRKINSASISTGETAYNTSSEQIVYACIYNEYGQLIGGMNYEVQNGIAELRIGTASDSVETFISAIENYLTTADQNLADVLAAIAAATDATTLELLNAQKSYYESEIQYLNDIKTAAGTLKDKLAQLKAAFPAGDKVTIEDLALDAKVAADALMDAFQVYVWKIGNIYADAQDRSEKLESLLDKAKDDASLALDYEEEFGVYTTARTDSAGSSITEYWRKNTATGLYEVYKKETVTQTTSATGTKVETTVVEKLNKSTNTFSKEQEIIKEYNSQGLLITETIETYEISSSGVSTKKDKAVKTYTYAAGNTLTQIDVSYSEMQEIEDPQDATKTINDYVVTAKEAIKITYGGEADETRNTYIVDLGDGTETYISQEKIDWLNADKSEYTKTYYLVTEALKVDAEGNAVLDANGNQQTEEKLVEAKKIEKTAASEKTTVYEIENGTAAGYTEEIKTLDAGGRVTSSVKTHYAYDSTSGFVMDSKETVSLTYASSNAANAMFNTITGVARVTETYDGGELVESKSEQVTLDEGLAQIDKCNFLEELKTDFGKEVLKAYRTLLYGDTDNVNDYGLMGDLITYNQDIYYNIPLRQQIESRSVWSTAYNSFGQVVSNGSYKLEFGAGIDQAMYSADSVGDLGLWISFYKEQLTAKAQSLADEAAMLRSEGRTEDADALLSEAADINSLITSLDEIQQKANAAVLTADELFAAIRNGDQQRIDSLRATLLGQVDLVVNDIALLVTGAEALLPKIDNLLIPKQDDLSDLQEELTALQEIDEPTADQAKQMADLESQIKTLTETVDIWQSYQADIEEISGKLYGMKETMDMLASSIPFESNVFTEYIEENMVYNDLNQVVSYDARTNQGGAGRGEGLSAATSSTYLYATVQSLVSIFGDAATFDALHGDLQDAGFGTILSDYTQAISSIKTLAEAVNKAARALFDAINKEEAKADIEAKREEYRQAISDLRQAAVNFYLDVADAITAINESQSDIDDELVTVTDDLAGAQSSLDSIESSISSIKEEYPANYASRTDYQQYIDYKDIAQQKVNELTAKKETLETKSALLENLLGELQFIEDQALKIKDQQNSLGESIPTGYGSQNVLHRTEITYNSNNQITGYKDDNASSGLSIDSIWHSSQQADTLSIEIAHMLANLEDDIAEILTQLGGLNVSPDTDPADADLTDEERTLLEELGSMSSKKAELGAILSLTGQANDLLEQLSAANMNGTDTAAIQQDLLDVYSSINQEFLDLELSYDTELNNANDDLSALREASDEAQEQAEYFESVMISVGTYTVTSESTETDTNGLTWDITKNLRYQLGAEGESKLVSMTSTRERYDDQGNLIEKRVVEWDAEYVTSVTGSEASYVLVPRSASVTKYTYENNVLAKEEKQNYKYDQDADVKWAKDGKEVTAYTYQNGLKAAEVVEYYSDDNNLTGQETISYTYTNGLLTKKEAITAWSVSGYDDATQTTTSVLEDAARAVTTYTYDSKGNLLTEDQKGYIYGDNATQALSSWTQKSYVYDANSRVSKETVNKYSVSEGKPYECEQVITNYAYDSAQNKQITSQVISNYNVSTTAPAGYAAGKTGFYYDSASGYYYKKTYMESRSSFVYDAVHKDCVSQFSVIVYEYTTEGEKIKMDESEVSWNKVSQWQLEAEAVSAAVEDKEESVENLSTYISDFGLFNASQLSMIEDLPFAQSTQFATVRSGIEYDEVGRVMSYSDTTQNYLSLSSSWMSIIKAGAIKTYIEYLMKSASDDDKAKLDSILMLVTDAQDKAKSLFDAISAGSEDLKGKQEACIAAFEAIYQEASKYSELVQLAVINDAVSDASGISALIDSISSSTSGLLATIEASIASLEQLKAAVGDIIGTGYNDENDIDTELNGLEEDRDIFDDAEGITAIVEDLVLAFTNLKSAASDAAKLAYYNQIVAGLDDLSAQLTEYENNVIARSDSRESLIESLNELASSETDQARINAINNSMDIINDQLAAEQDIIAIIDDTVSDIADIQSKMIEGVGTANRIVALASEAISYVPFETNTVTKTTRNDIKYDELGMMLSYTETTTSDGISMESLWHSISYAANLMTTIENINAVAVSSEDKAYIKKIYTLAETVKTKLESLKEAVASKDAASMTAAQNEVANAILKLSVAAGDFKAAKESDIDTLQKEADILDILSDRLEDVQKELPDSDTTTSARIDTLLELSDKKQDEIADAQLGCDGAREIYDAMMVLASAVPYSANSSSVVSWSDGSYDSDGKLISYKQETSTSGVSASQAVESILRVNAVISYLEAVIDTNPTNKAAYKTLYDAALDLRNDLTGFKDAIVSGGDYQSMQTAVNEKISAFGSMVNDLSETVNSSFEDTINSLKPASGRTVTDAQIIGYIASGDYKSAYAYTLAMLDSAKADADKVKARGTAAGRLAEIYDNDEMKDVLASAAQYISETAEPLDEKAGIYESLSDALERASVISNFDMSTMQKIEDLQAVASKIVADSQTITSKSEKYGIVYDDLGHEVRYDIVSEDAAGNKTRERHQSMHYDSKGRIASEYIIEYSSKLTEKKRALKQYQYDDNSRIRKTKETKFYANGVKASATETALHYDSMNQVSLQEKTVYEVDEKSGKETLYSREVTREMRYDSAGSMKSCVVDYYTASEGLLSKLASTKVMSNMCYDSKGRLLSQSTAYYNESSIKTYRKDSLFMYDAAGNVIQTTDHKYDANGLYRGKSVVNMLYSYNKFRRLWEAYMKITKRYDRYSNLYHIDAENLGVAPVTELAGAETLGIFNSPRKFKTYDLNALQGEVQDAQSDEDGNLISGTVLIKDADGNIIGKAVIQDTKYDAMGNVLSQTVLGYDADNNYTGKETIENRYMVWTVSGSEPISKLIAQKRTRYDANNSFLDSTELNNFYSGLQVSSNVYDFGTAYEFVSVQLEKAPVLYQQVSRDFNQDGTYVEGSEETKQFGTFTAGEIMSGLNLVSYVRMAETNILDLVSMWMEYGLISAQDAQQVIAALEAMKGLTAEEAAKTGGKITITLNDGTVYNLDAGGSIESILSDYQEVREISVDENGYITSAVIITYSNKEHTKVASAQKIDFTYYPADGEYAGKVKTQIVTSYSDYDGKQLDDNNIISIQDITYSKYNEDGQVAEQAVITQGREADGALYSISKQVTTDIEYYTDGKIKHQKVKTYGDSDKAADGEFELVSIQVIDLKYKPDSDQVFAQSIATYGGEDESGLINAMNKQVISGMTYNEEGLLTTQTVATFGDGSQDAQSWELISVEKTYDMKYDPENNRVSSQIIETYNDAQIDEDTLEVTNLINGISRQVISGIEYDTEDRMIHQLIETQGDPNGAGQDGSDSAGNWQTVSIQDITIDKYNEEDRIQAQTVITFNSKDASGNPVDAINKQKTWDMAYDEQDRLSHQIIAVYGDGSTDASKALKSEDAWTLINVQYVTIDKYNEEDRVKAQTVVTYNGIGPDEKLVDAINKQITTDIKYDAEDRMIEQVVETAAARQGIDQDEAGAQGNWSTVNVVKTEINKYDVEDRVREQAITTYNSKDSQGNLSEFINKEDVRDINYDAEDRISHQIVETYGDATEGGSEYLINIKVIDNLKFNSEDMVAEQSVKTYNDKTGSDTLIEFISAVKMVDMQYDSQNMMNHQTMINYSDEDMTRAIDAQELYILDRDDKDMVKEQVIIHRQMKGSVPGDIIDAKVMSNIKYDEEDRTESQEVTTYAGNDYLSVSKSTGKVTGTVIQKLVEKDIKYNNEDRVKSQTRVTKTLDGSKINGSDVISVEEIADMAYDGQDRLTQQTFTTKDKEGAAGSIHQIREMTDITYDESRDRMTGYEIAVMSDSQLIYRQRIKNIKYDEDGMVKHQELQVFNRVTNVDTGRPVYTEVTDILARNADFEPTQTVVAKYNGYGTMLEVRSTETSYDAVTSRENRMVTKLYKGSELARYSGAASLAGLNHISMDVTEIKEWDDATGLVKRQSVTTYQQQQKIVKEMYSIERDQFQRVEGYEQDISEYCGRAFGFHAYTEEWN